MLDVSSEDKPLFNNVKYAAACSVGENTVSLATLKILSCTLCTCATERSPNTSMSFNCSSKFMAVCAAPPVIINPAPLAINASMPSRINREPCRPSAIAF